MSSDPPARNELTTAVFVDFENLALGVEQDKKGRFEIELVLKRLLERGRIVFKRAYCDWTRFQNFMREFHMHGFEMVDIPRSNVSGKNSADIRMVVDAMDLTQKNEHIDTFAIVSGDSDFSPLVSKLRENDKYVIGLGVKNSSSELLVANCDEFIFYEDLTREAKKGTLLKGLPEKKAEVFAQLIDAVQALQRENKEVLWGSMVKQTMIRKNPAFSESYYGYSTFSKLKENNKHVLGCGVRSSTSDLLAGNCDEFIFYDDLIRVSKQPRQKPKKGESSKQQEAFERLTTTIESLETDYDPVWGSLVKQTVRRVYPGFNESYYGYRNFSDLLEHAAKEGLITLDRDPQRGNYRVRTVR